MKTAKITIIGKVQNVGFRNFAKRKADEYKIKGYVKNSIDGNVEIIAAGDEFKLEKFIRECRRGPLLASIKEVNVSYITEKERGEKLEENKKKSEEDDDSEESNGFEIKL